MKYCFNKYDSQKNLSSLKLFFYSIILSLSFSTVNAELINHERLETDPIFDGEVFVQEIGNPENEVVVLVHGLGAAASTDWEETISELKEDFYVVTLDLPGFGKSSKGDKVYTPTKYATLIRYITSMYIAKPFHLVGHSMGGAIALRYISKYPEDVKTLTIIDAAGLLHRLAYTKFLAPMGLEMLTGYKIPGGDKISNAIGTIMTRFERKIPVDLGILLSNSMMREKVLQGNPSVISAFGLVMEDFSDVPRRINVPTLIVWGDEDDIAPLRTGYALNSMIPNSEMRIISGAGHVPIKNNFEEYITHLKKHLVGELKKTVKIKPRQLEHQGDLSCRKKKSAYYTGNIGKLTLSGCRNVVIENAYIEELIINKTRVKIRNTDIVSDDVALTASRSIINITAGSITGNIGIKTSAGKFDIAGTEINGREEAIKSHKNANFIFSLTTVNSKPIHGLQVISYKVPFSSEKNN